MEATATVTITPTMLAEAFWKLDTVEQTEFFAALHAEVTATMAIPGNWAWSLGEMQWCNLADKMEASAQAREMLMAMAAPQYLNVLRYAEAA